jgi:elongation factor Ts
MADISADAVKQLRDRTGLSVMQCKKALEEAQGDMDKALEILSRKSADVARKKGDRTLGAGAVASYIHGGGQIGALVLLSCETDFVSKNEEFVALARDIAMQAAATRPQYVRREDVSPEELSKLRELFAPEAAGKPADIREKVIEGKVNSRLSETVLLEQPFIKDDAKKIQDLIDAASHKFGERVELSKCAWFSVRG